MIIEWNDDTRIYTNHITGEQRPYTEQENADADLRGSSMASFMVEDTLKAGLAKVITRALEYQANAQAIIDDTNANIKSNPAPAIKALARGQKRSAGDIIRLARLAGGLLDSTNTGDET